MGEPSNFLSLSFYLVHFFRPRNFLSLSDFLQSSSAPVLGRREG